MIYRLLVIPALLLFLVSCGRSELQPKQGSATISAIDSLLASEVAGPLPGAVVRVQQGDSVLHENAYGFARMYGNDLQPVEQPDTMRVDHLFDLASLTKVFVTTFGIMMLVDEGSVHLDDPIHRWLPEFSEGKKRDITLRHLLSHSAGLCPWKPTYYRASDPAEQYGYIAALPLQYPVGEGRHYSDLGFMLLGEIIHRITGSRVDRFLRDRLYEPLGLRRTCYTPLEHGMAAGEIAATSHGNPFERQMVYDDSFGYNVDLDPELWDGWRQYTLRGEVNDGNAWYGAGGVAAHAGLFSMAADLQVLITLLLNGGNRNGEQLISPAVVDTFLTENRFGNGLGWAMDPAVFSAEGVPAGSFGHTGFTGTSVAVIPEKQLSIILLTNRQHAGRLESGYYYDLDPLRQKLVDIVLQFDGHGKNR
ncbi:MAG: serine hydrolase [Balneolaceae bacterium]|nr:serine hydrolase [Balneolaceae bacterium]